MTIEINQSNNQDIDGILWGWAWGDGGPENLTFSFPTGTAEYSAYTAVNGFGSFNATQAEAVRDILANIASVCNLTFTETTAAGATLRYAEATSINYTNDSSVGRFTGLHSISTAEAAPPELAYNGVAPFTPTYAQGDSWFNTSLYDNPLLGSFAYAAGVMHETGHNLGLKHGHVAQNGHGITFPMLPADHNSYEYSVMTYSQFPGDSTADGDNAPHHPTTYMQDDIAALQYLYGANYGASAQNGDTVYTWSPTTGEASINGVGQGAPIANYVLMTIWDGGGIDTYNLSNYTTNLSVNLNPGAWTILDTSIAQAQRANLGNTGGGPTYFARGNIANALTDPNNPSETLSLIEHATGGAGHDILVGNGIGNTLQGNGGNDTLQGNGGNDTLIGGSGIDTLHGGDGDDTITSDGDTGVYNGDAGNDTMFSGFGGETMDGGTGIDLIDHTIYDSDYVFNMTTGLTQFIGESYANFEHTRMGDGNDTVTGNAANNVIEGGVGNDTLTGGLGTDTLHGGDGNDTITSDGDTGVYNGDAGNDTMFSGFGGETMDGGTGIDLIDHTIYDSDYVFNMTTGLTQFIGESYANFEHTRMGDGNDTVTGNAADNVIEGGVGHDTLIGGSGVDTLHGGDGDDTITSDGDTGVYNGDAGNDTMFSGFGGETMDGGTGIDLIDHTIYDSDYVFNMTTGLTQFIGESYANFEHTRMGDGNDTVTGNAADNVIEGGVGHDTLIGGSGVDTLHGGDGDDTITSDGDTGVYNGNAGNDTMFSGVGNEFMDGGVGIDLIDHASWDGDYVFDMSTGLTNWVGETYLNFEQARMGDGNDTVTGNAADNVIEGGVGNDTLSGVDGNDILEGGAGDDSLDGGAGTDTASYLSAAVGVTVNLALAGGQNTVGAGIDTLSNVENLQGSNFGDTLTGNGAGNLLFGGDGNDQLDGGTGADTLNGGDDDDLYLVDHVGDVAAEDFNDFPGGVDSVQSSVTHTLGFGIEHLTLTGTAVINGTGNGNNNTILGNSGNNILDGGLGDDVLNGGAGTDAVSYGTAAAGVTVSLLLAGAQNTIGAGIDTLSNFENLRGSAFDDALTGDGKSNILIGGLGNDLLNGGAATDTVSYETATAGVTVSLLLAGAQNTIGAGTDTLSNFESLRGSNFNDMLTGNGGTNILTGGVGNDVLNGDAGSDTASYETASAGVTVSLALAGPQNTVGAGTDTLSNFENLRGSNFNDTLTGNAASNVIIGHVGDDLLNGDAGTDTASYETSTVGVTVSLAIAGAQNTIGAGTDTLINFEHLRGGVANDTLTGNGGSNIITGGLGNDVLDGGAGTDTASYDTAFGGVTVNLGLVGAQNTVNAGTDTLSNFENLKGSIHNDTLTGNAASNVIIGDQGNDVLNGDAGIDTASYETAKAGVVVSLLLAGVGQNTGNAGTDTLLNFENLRGSNFNDTLTGDAGGNTLLGGLGNDTMTGNGGADSFVFNTALNAATNTDIITDFIPVDDTLTLENAIFTQFVATGAIPTGTFVSNAGGIAGDANDVLLYDTTTGKLFYDADGNGAGAKVEFVTLVGIPALTAADFAII